MDEQEFGQLNVIPLVDIMLVLLTIVLTTASFASRGTIPVDLPRASRTQSEAQAVLTLELDATGSIFLKGRPVSLALLSRSLEAEQRSLPVLIRSDQRAKLQNFVDVLSLLKGMGFSKVSIQTDERRKG